ncbi:hypothetical protein [Natronobiforma cellulositropha]|uniref:hypothetical protein n=1 Tax=Natronobiforma cellulositropha TaxID=1679076 RepID=UPI0021D57950|nr:hypothetical protein [Natronobiforma cellulositropha]
MAETVDAQATTIGLGMLVVVCVLLYGTVVDPTPFGVESMTLAMWVFAAMFATVALLHAVVGRGDMALAHGGAAVGWVLILVGTGVGQVTVGLVALAAGGIYIVRTTVRERD